MIRGIHGRRLLTLVVSATLATLVSGCAIAGEHQDPTSRADGDNVSMRGMQLRNIFVLGPAPGETLPAGGTAEVYVTLINQRAEPDRLVSVEAPEFARSVQLIGGPVTLPPGEVVLPGGRGPAEVVDPRGPGPGVILQDLTTQLRGGEYIRLTFRFAEAGTVEASVPVMPYANFYTTYPATPSPTPSPTR